MHKFKKTMKLVISMVLVVAILGTSCVFGTDKETEEILSKGQANVIEWLYEKRALLSLDFEKNTEEIFEIDRRINQLGASDISFDSVISKMDLEVSPRRQRKKAPLPTNSGVKWSSYRQKTNVNGTLFEIQVITGVPSTSNSPLLAHQVTYSKTPNATYKAVGELVYSLAAVGAEKIPGVSQLITISDIAKKAYGVATVSNATTVYGVNCSALTSVTSTIKHIYIKYDGAPDSSQICMYMGNSSRCRTTFTVGYNKKNSDGSYTATNEPLSVDYTIQSSGFTDYSSICWNYYKYKTSGTVFESDHYVHKCTLYFKYRKNGSLTQIKNGTITLPTI